MSLARPQLAAVLAALTDCREHEEQPAFWLSLDGCRLELVASDGAWFDAPRQSRAPEGRSVRRRWVTTNPAEAWEFLQTRGLVPMDYEGCFVCGDCHGSGTIVPDGFDWPAVVGREVTFEPCVFCGGNGTRSLPLSMTDLIAWASIGFAARDDGSPGILGAEEMARATSQPCPFVWTVAPAPPWWSRVLTPNADRLRASGLSWWAAEGRVVLAVPPL